MVQFRFLGILMAVAIRTKKPLDLHLAPWVWKQLCSMPLGGPDLEEVDLLTYRTLQGILHLENSGITEDNFHVVRCHAESSVMIKELPPSSLKDVQLLFHSLSPLPSPAPEDDPPGFLYGPQCRWEAGTCGPWRAKHLSDLCQPKWICGESAGLQAAWNGFPGLNCWRMVWVYSGDLLSTQTATHLNIREYWCL